MKESITLRRAVMEDGKKIKTIKMDLDQLTGQDLVDAEREYLALGGIPTNMSISVNYQQILAAKACGLDGDAIRRMGAKDAVYLASRVQVFLLDMDLPSPEKE